MIIRHLPIFLNNGRYCARPISTSHWSASVNSPFLLPEVSINSFPRDSTMERAKKTPDSTVDHRAIACGAHLQRERNVTNQFGRSELGESRLQLISHTQRLAKSVTFLLTLFNRTDARTASISRGLTDNVSRLEVRCATLFINKPASDDRPSGDQTRCRFAKSAYHIFAREGVCSRARNRLLNHISFTPERRTQRDRRDRNCRWSPRRRETKGNPTAVTGGKMVSVRRRKKNSFATTVRYNLSLHLDLDVGGIAEIKVSPTYIKEFSKRSLITDFWRTQASRTAMPRGRCLSNRWFATLTAFITRVYGTTYLRCGSFLLGRYDRFLESHKVL